VREREREREKKLTRMETMEEVTVGKRHINMAEGKFWLAVLCFYYLYILIGWCLAVQYCPNIGAVTHHDLSKTLVLLWVVGAMS
jgi:hypothetical protein